MKGIASKFEENKAAYFDFKKEYLAQVVKKFKNCMMKIHCEVSADLSSLLKKISFPGKAGTSEKQSITTSYLLSKGTQELEEDSNEANHTLFSESNINQENRVKQKANRHSQVGLKDDISNSLIKSTGKGDPQAFFDLNSHKLSVIKPKQSFMSFTGISFNPILSENFEMIQEVSQDNSELEPTIILQSNKKPTQEDKLISDENREESGTCSSNTGTNNTGTSNTGTTNTGTTNTGTTNTGTTNNLTTNPRTTTQTEVESESANSLDEKIPSETDLLLKPKNSSEKSLNRLKPRHRISNLTESKTMIRNSGLFSNNPTMERESEFFYDVSEINSLPRDSLNVRNPMWTKNKTKSTMSRTMDLSLKNKSPSKLTHFNTQNFKSKDLQVKIDQPIHHKLQQQQGDFAEYPDYSENNLSYNLSSDSNKVNKQLDNHILKIADQINHDQEIQQDYNKLGNSVQPHNPEDALLKGLMYEDDDFPSSQKKRRKSTYRSLDDIADLPDFLNNF